jgi:hypothetical protein
VTSQAQRGPQLCDVAGKQNTAGGSVLRPAVLSVPNLWGSNWRKGRDSNPRQGFPCSGLANRRTRPTMRPFRIGAYQAKRPSSGADRDRAWTWCQRGDSNPHGRYAHNALNVACLPISPLWQGVAGMPNAPLQGRDNTILPYGSMPCQAP